MNRAGQVQTSFASGEVDAQAGARAELKAWHAGARLMSRIEPIPQGGFGLSPGSTDIGGIRFAMPELGGAGPVTIDLAGAGQIAEIDLGAVAAVAAVDLTVRASVAGTVTVSVINGAASVALPSLATTTADKTRRLAFEPGRPASGRYVRLGWGGPAATVTLTLATARGEDLTPSRRVRVRPFAWNSIAGACMMVLTPAGADFWAGGVYRGAASLPYTADQFDGLGHPEALFKTCLLWHADVPPHRILYEADHDWLSAPAPLERLPQVDYGGVYTKTTEVWRLYLRFQSGTAGAEIDFQITVNGEQTETVSTGATPDWPAVSAAIVAAVEALPSVQAGVAVSHVVKTGLVEFTLSFGGSNDGQNFGVSGTVTSSTESALTASRVTRGDPGGEPIASVTRGWPVTGRFYQDRLLMAGFRSEQPAVAASQSGEYYTFDIDVEASTGAVLFRALDAVDQVHTLVPARHLVMFTDQGLSYISDRAIVRTTPPNVVASGDQGASRSVPIINHQNELYYLSADGSVIYSAAYDDVGQVYRADPVSLLASHLVKGIIDAALMPGSAATDAARYLLVRDDGLMLNVILMRGQDIAAFTRWPTAGAVRAVAADRSRTAFVAVERTIAGAPRGRLERVEPGELFDGTVTRVLAPAGTTVTGLDMHEGAPVWAETAEGWIFGPFVVTVGAIELPLPTTSARVGRWTPPRLQPMPMVRDVADGLRLRRPVRVHTVRAYSTGTQSLALGTAGGPPRDVPLWRVGMPTDQPLAPVTGDIIVDGLTGYSDDGDWELTQLKPGRLKIRDLIVSARM